MRLYLPSTLPALAAAWRAREFGPPPLTAYAVTPALREWYTDGDEEELEYAAMAQAARDSVGRLAADPGAPWLRVVVACELSAVPPAGADVELGSARLELATAVPWSSVAAVHVDAAAAAPGVGAAAEAWAAAQHGDEDAVFALDSCEAEDLLWYATQEVPDLLDRESTRNEARSEPEGNTEGRTVI
jgi:uncharacterized protein DUF6912